MRTSINGISVINQIYDGMSGFNNLILRTRNRCNVSEVGSERGGVSTPSSFGLQQNFPNPFNPTTAIKYRVEQSGSVRLTIFDELGKDLITLINESQNARWHQVARDGRENANRAVATGVYFYSLIGESNVRAKNLVVEMIFVNDRNTKTSRWKVCTKRAWDRTHELLMYSSYVVMTWVVRNYVNQEES